ncbi:MAG: neutral/alkaline non-lysosomal ceramidase N-terminal domain-containing protein [Planctomycetaceae bacterium]|nr:neutral/alkaline non-lysosomal ceramidase N-terminal domain-containing protein [Planctomycetaceae bacterium]
MKAQAGVSRTSITPVRPVELTGWGYYLERFWQEIHDPLYASALVIDSEESCVVILSLDLMVISREFTQQIRSGIASVTGISPDNILITATHTHNAPASGGLRGVGEVDTTYETWAAEQAIRAAIEAWNSREPAELSVASTSVEDLTFNRTRDNGPVDPHLTTLLIQRPDESALAILVGFQGHPTVATKLRPFSVSRDLPGELCDHLEKVFPEAIAIYLQGACGDVNFHRSFSESETRASLPARQLCLASVHSLSGKVPLDPTQFNAACRNVKLPTRRWTLEEIHSDRDEAERRMEERDLTGWRETIGRVMTTRPHEMVLRHGGDEWKAVAAMCRFNLEWTDEMLADLETRPEWLETEIQGIRLGEFGIVANSSEFFTSLALDVRERVELPYLMLACYSNGRIGYLPDAYDVERKTYAAYQSPKYCNQFPFTEESGPVMVEAMSELMNSL